MTTLPCYLNTNLQMHNGDLVCTPMGKLSFIPELLNECQRGEIQLVRAREGVKRRNIGPVNFPVCNRVMFFDHNGQSITWDRNSEWPDADQYPEFLVMLAQ